MTKYHYYYPLQSYFYLFMCLIFIATFPLWVQAHFSLFVFYWCWLSWFALLCKMFIADITKYAIQRILNIKELSQYPAALVQAWLRNKTSYYKYLVSILDFDEKPVWQLAACTPAIFGTVPLLYFMFLYPYV